VFLLFSVCFLLFVLGARGPGYAHFGPGASPPLPFLAWVQSQYGPYPYLLGAAGVNSNPPGRGHIWPTLFHSLISQKFINQETFEKNIYSSSYVPSL
jgi:hypothetical protein